MTSRPEPRPAAGAAAARRTEILLCAVTLLGVAFFHQGGGWNQNSRFALVRSIVEARTFFIDAYLVYGIGPDDDPDALVRFPLRHGSFEREGTRYAAAWRDPRGTLVPVDPSAASGATPVAIEDVAASGDVAYQGGHFHPNKAPGTSWLAVPAYAVLRVLEGVLGLAADRWWVLTVNAWLVTALSVGVVTALGAVLVLRLARTLASERDAALTALVSVFGTMTWPHGTLLLEHNVVAAALLASFYGIERARAAAAAAGDPRGIRSAAARLAGAGFCAGYAAICNYTMAPLVLAFGGYAMLRLASWRAGRWFGLGVAGPLALACAYNLLCFGTPFTTNYAYENPLFVSAHGLLGVFAVPRADVLAALLVSPFRGLFFTSPVLLLGVAGLVSLLRGRDRAWGALIALVTGFLLLVNASFNGWDGGWTAVPRYLGPAVPFLTLPIALMWRRWLGTACALAAVAIVTQCLLTTVDPQVPIGDVGTAGVAVRTIWGVNPLTRYVLPLFIDGRATPMLDDLVDRAVRASERRSTARGVPAEERARHAGQLRADLRARVERGEPTPFPLAAVTGPVSANQIGIYEGGYYRLFAPGSAQATYNAFNVGELLFPRSRLSLLPLLLVGGVLVVELLGSARRGESD